MNVVTLTGRLTKDLSFKKTNYGYFFEGAMAVDRTDEPKKDGKWETDFLPLRGYITDIQYEKLYSKYLKKGDYVAVIGSVRAERYNKKDGSKDTFWYIKSTAINFESVGGKPKNSNENQTQNQNQNQSFEPSFEPVGLDPQGFQAIDDDDIPF